MQVSGDVWRYLLKVRTFIHILDVVVQAFASMNVCAALSSPLSFPTVSRISIVLARQKQHLIMGNSTVALEVVV